MYLIEKSGRDFSVKMKTSHGLLPYGYFILFTHRLG